MTIAWQLIIGVYVAGYVISYYPILKQNLATDSWKTCDKEYDKYGITYGERYRDKNQYQDLTLATIGMTFFWPLGLLYFAVSYPFTLLYKLTRLAANDPEEKQKVERAS